MLKIMKGDIPSNMNSQDLRRIPDFSGIPDIEEESHLDDMKTLGELMMGCWSLDPNERPHIGTCRESIQWMVRYCQCISFQNAYASCSSVGVSLQVECTRRIVPGDSRRRGHWKDNILSQPEGNGQAMYPSCKAMRYTYSPRWSRKERDKFNI